MGVAKGNSPLPGGRSVVLRLPETAIRRFCRGSEGFTKFCGDWHLGLVLNSGFGG